MAGKSSHKKMKKQHGKESGRQDHCLTGDDFCFETFEKYIKKTREEPITFFAKRGLHPPPKKLELLVDIDRLE